ncbi:MAG TPA: hypothetical protein VFQ35_03740, partial [Polyangiaceae bacterium]|nr:hypothetical protein [Polyangiaceae bacterium]
MTRATSVHRAARLAKLPAVPPATVAEKGSLPPAGAANAGQLVFEAAAPDARWVTVCQARNDTNGDGRVSTTVSERGEWLGDRMQRYLELATGAEQAIEDLLLSSPDGRWLVLRLDGHVELYDTLTGARRDLSALGADSRPEPNDFTNHRALAFSTDSLFYLRNGDGGSELVRLSLLDGNELVLLKSSDPIARLRLDPAGKLITLSIARAENARNGRFVWPHRLDDAPRPCRGPFARFQGPNPNADPLTSAVVDVDGAHAEFVD